MQIRPMLTAGIDVGSAAIKIAVVRDATAPASSASSPAAPSASAGAIRSRSRRGLFDDRARAKPALAPERLGYVATTGEGEASRSAPATSTA